MCFCWQNYVQQESSTTSFLAAWTMRYRFAKSTFSLAATRPSNFRWALQMSTTVDFGMMSFWSMLLCETQFFSLWIILSFLRVTNNRLHAFPKSTQNSRNRHCVCVCVCVVYECKHLQCMQRSRHKNSVQWNCFGILYMCMHIYTKWVRTMYYMSITCTVYVILHVCVCFWTLWAFLSYRHPLVPRCWIRECLVYKPSFMVMVCSQEFMCNVDHTDCQV